MCIVLSPAYLTTLALNVKLFAILKSLRKRESSFKDWIPGQARNDTYCKDVIETLH